MPGGLQVTSAHLELAEDEQQSRIPGPGGDESDQEAVRGIESAQCNQVVDQLQQYVACRFIERVRVRPVRNPVAGCHRPCLVRGAFREERLEKMVQGMQEQPGRDLSFQ